MLYSDINLDWEPGKSELLYDEEAVEQAIQSLLRTRFGERFFRPEFGSDLEAYLHELNDPVTVARLEDFVFTSLSEFEPRVVVNTGKSFISSNPEKGSVEVYLAYSIKGFGVRMFEHIGDLRSILRLPTTPYAKPAIEVTDTSTARKAKPISPIAIFLTLSRSIIDRTDSVTLKPTIIDPQQSAVSFLTEWGDGTPSDTTPGGTHVYQRPGEYDVRFSVTDKLGGTTVKTIPLVVRQFVPVPLNPPTMLAKVRLSTNDVVDVAAFYWDKEFQYSRKVPFVQDGVWDGSYRYLFSNDNTKPGASAYLVSFYNNGVLMTVWVNPT